jgi:two-component system chemotaxis response regulator CheB
VPHREPRAAAERIALIGIGASTGGPPVLQAVLAGLPKDFVAPILVVQHIAHGFLPGLADWLTGSTDFDVRLASFGIRPLPGRVYLAPDDHHMGIDRNGRILLSKAPPENGSRPAVSFLFRSLAKVCGPKALGVLLTGMGRDGAAELKLMKDAGATTIAQDRESSVVHGMPGAAIAMGGASRVLPAGAISQAIETLLNERDGKERPK